MALNNIPISEDQCIGDSLDTINDSFVELDSRTLTNTGNIASLSSTLNTAQTNISSLSSTLNTAQTNISSLSSNCVRKIVAGANVTISPTNGIGIVTINSTGGGGGSFAGTTTASTLTADTLMLRVEVGSYYKYIQLFDINGVYNEPITPLTNPPAITSTLTASGTANIPFSYQITATNSPSGYNASGLPSGLTVNTGSGAITGTPAVSGVSTVSLSARNQYGTGTASLTLTVTTSAVVISTPLFSISGPFGENIPQQINITSSNPDTLYIYDNWNGSTLTYTSTIVSVNGTPRASISHTTDRIGDQFGYSTSGVVAQAYGTLTGGNVNITI